MLKKYLFVAIFSLLALLILIGRTEGHMPWRSLMQLLPNKEIKEWNKREKSEYRKKEYKIMLILWVVMTLIALVYVIFFVDL